MSPTVGDIEAQVELRAEQRDHVDVLGRESGKRCAAQSLQRERDIEARLVALRGLDQARGIAGEKAGDILDTNLRRREATRARTKLRLELQRERARLALGRERDVESQSVDARSVRKRNELATRLPALRRGLESELAASERSADHIASGLLRRDDLLHRHAQSRERDLDRRLREHAER